MACGEHPKPNEHICNRQSVSEKPRWGGSLVFYDEKTGFIFHVNTPHHRSPDQKNHGSVISFETTLLEGCFK